MKSKMLARAMASAVAAVVLGAGSARAEDLTIVSNVTMGKGAAKTSTQYVSADRVRTSDGEHDTILEYGTGRMVMIDHKKKEYFETSQAEMVQFLGQLEAQLHGNPIMEKMIGKVTDVTVQKGSGGRKIAGYDTQQYVLSMGDNLKFDLLVAPALPTPVQYFDARKASYAAMGPMGKRFEKMFDEMKKIKGFPLATGIDAKMMMFKQQTLSEATEVKKGPIPASAFEIPAGYKKKPSPFAKKG